MMKMNMGKAGLATDLRSFFSVIMPLHNKRNYLLRSIESVLSQTLSDFELIVIDDASTDGGGEVVASFADHRIRLLHRDDPGPGGYAARDLGASVARAQWLAFLDADDEWRPDHLHLSQRLLTDYPDVDFLFFGHSYTKAEVSPFGYATRSMSVATRGFRLGLS